MTIFTIWVQDFPNYLVIFLAAAVLAGGFVYTFARSAMVAQGGRQSSWTRRVTGPNSKLVFTALFLAWAVIFGVGLQLVPHEGASSPYGGIGLIAMFSGFFIMMGLIWSVIGD